MSTQAVVPPRRASLLRLVLPAGGALTPFAAVPIGAGAVLAALAALTGDTWLHLLATAAIGLLLAALVVRPRLTGLEVRFPAPVRLYPGDEVEHEVVATNSGPRATSGTQLVHAPPGFDPVTLYVPPLAPGTSASVRVRRRATARGHSIAQAPVASSSEPFSLVRVTRELRTEQLFAVHPAPVPITLPPATAGRGAEESWMPARLGADLHGIREWRPGDAVRDVSWRHTARHGQLIVGERGTAPAARLAIVVCGPAAHPKWEAVVAVVASTAIHVVRDGRHVGLLTDEPGRPHVLGGPPVALLDWCAALSAPAQHRAEVLEHAVRWAGPGGDVLIAAPAGFPSEAWQYAAGIAVKAGARLGSLHVAPGAAA